MRRNGRMLVILGVVLALVAAALVVMVLSSGGSGTKDTAAASEAPKDVIVVQAKKDVTAHSLLDQGDFEEVKVDGGSASADAVHSINEIIGFAYNSDLQKGQRLERSALEEPGLANELDPGKRAIALPVDKNNLVGGLLREDDHIDISYDVTITKTRVLPGTPLEVPENATYSGDVTLPPYGEDPGPTYPYPGEPGSRFAVTGGDGADPVVKIVLQNIKILRVVNADATSGGDAGDYIVVEVDPQQVELVTFMVNQGKYQVSLRNGSDTDVATTSGMNYQELMTQYAFPIPSTIRLPGPGAQ